MSSPTPSRKPSIPSRKSSTPSRTPLPRPPPSLLIPSARASSSTAFVFAQGQSEPTTQPQAPAAENEVGKNGASSATGTIPKRQGSASEEALSRQLDGDLGGRLMELRSRRGSPAAGNTLNTLATAGATRQCSGKNGAEPDSPRKADELGASIATGSNSIAEDNERERGRSAVASPSNTVAEPGMPSVGGAVPSNGNLTVPVLSSKREGEPMSSHSKTLGKKTSNSWLRWTSPTPTFPKGCEDKGKRKSKEEILKVFSAAFRIVRSSLTECVQDQTPVSTNEPQVDPSTNPASSTATSSYLPSGSQTSQLSQQTTTGTEPLRCADQDFFLRSEQNSSIDQVPQSQALPSPKKEEKQGWFNSFSRSSKLSAPTSLYPSHGQGTVESIIRGSKQNDGGKDMAKAVEVEGSVGIGATVQSNGGVKTKKDTRRQEETDKPPSTSASPNPPLAEGEMRPDMSYHRDSNNPPYAAEVAAPTSIRVESINPSATATQIQEQSQQKKKVHPQQSTASLRGFRNYLGWSGASAEGKEVSLQEGEGKGSASNSGVDEQEEVRSEDGEVHIRRITLLLILCIVTQTSKETSTPTQSTETTMPTPKGQPGPWSSYFYSFVVPEPKQEQTQNSRRGSVSIAPESENNPAAAAPPAQPTNTSNSSIQPQPALFTPLTTPSNTNTTSRSVSPARTSTTSMPAPGATAHPSAPSSSTSPSTSRHPSAAGWLNYLAFRANQKKITAGSVGTGGTDEGEVMDFSNDPNFPSGSSIVNATAGDASSKTAEGTSEDKSRPLTAPTKSVPTAIIHKPSRNLDVHKHAKRLSNASSLAGNVGSIAFSASPKNKSFEDHPSPGKSSTRSLTNPKESALPHPQPPAVQPNLVIPTFSSTFDRPPRSFPPLPPSPPSSPQPLDSKQQQHRGLTAATTGLAWKALGAVGSYVYGGAGAGNEVSGGGWVDDGTEKRGRKEGRKVGKELPRRLGLEHGGEEDGWKDVKRVVVVGVHGW